MKSIRLESLLSSAMDKLGNCWHLLDNAKTKGFESPPFFGPLDEFLIEVEGFLDRIQQLRESGELENPKSPKTLIPHAVSENIDPAYFMMLKYRVDTMSDDELMKTYRCVLAHTPVTPEDECDDGIEMPVGCSQFMIDGKAQWHCQSWVARALSLLIRDRMRRAREESESDAQSS